MVTGGDSSDEDDGERSEGFTVDGLIGNIGSELSSLGSGIGNIGTGIESGLVRERGVSRGRKASHRLRLVCKSCVRLDCLRWTIRTKEPSDHAALVPSPIPSVLSSVSCRPVASFSFSPSLPYSSLLQVGGFGVMGGLFRLGDDATRSDSEPGIP